MLLARSIVVSYATIRCWAKNFGPDYAGCLRRKAPSPSVFSAVRNPFVPALVKHAAIERHLHRLRAIAH